MSEVTVEVATKWIYESLQADNADIDERIASLKAALTLAGQKEAVFDPAKLVQSKWGGPQTDEGIFSPARRICEVLGLTVIRLAMKNRCQCLRDKSWMLQ